MLDFLRKNPDFDGKGKAADRLKDLAEYSKMLILLFEELYQDLEILELRYEAARLQVRLVERYVKTRKAALAADLRQTNSDKQNQTLLEQAKALDALFKSIRQGAAHAQGQEDQS